MKAIYVLLILTCTLAACLSAIHGDRTAVAVYLVGAALLVGQRLGPVRDE